MKLRMTQALARVTDAAIEALERRTRLDAWTNEVTGFGTSRDKTTYGRHVASPFLTDEEIATLYHHDDMAARMVDIVPQEMLREGFVVSTEEPELDRALAEKLDELGAAARLAEGVRWGRCFGGGAVLIGADDGRDASAPLVPERARDIRYLRSFDRRVLWPLTYYDDPGSPRLGEVRSYAVTSEGTIGSSVAEVHESRLLLFGGAPTGTRERAQLAGWDMSVLQRPHEVLRQFNTGWKSVEILLTDANQAVFKMTGLAEIVAEPDGEQKLQTRARLVDLYRSVLRAIVVDADSQESFERQTVSFSDIPATLDKFMLRLAAAVQIPVTILMGQSPAGMSATGDSDFRWFYDRIRSEQTTTLGPKIRRLADVWLRTRAGQDACKGRMPESLTVSFPSLWQETPANEATRRKAIAEADAIYVNASIFTPDEIALVRGRTDGFDKDLLLDDASVKAREQALKFDLEQISAGQRPTAGGDIDGESTFVAPSSPSQGRPSRAGAESSEP